MFFYTVFGINFSSSFVLPLTKSDEKSETVVNIQYGNVPSSIENPDNTGLLWQSSYNEFILRVPAIARYYVNSGKEIIIAKEPEASDDDVITFLLGRPFEALLEQRNTIRFNGCAMAKNNIGIILAGPSATGKSTLSACLLQKGFLCAGDDISAVKFESDSSFIMSGYPFLRLWHDTLLQLGLTPDNYIKTRSDIMKYYFPVIQPSKEFPLTHIIILSDHNKDNIEKEEVYGAEKIKALRTISMNYGNILPPASEAFIFKAYERISQQVKIFFLRRNIKNTDPNEAAQKIKDICL